MPPGSSDTARLLHAAALHFDVPLQSAFEIVLLRQVAPSAFMHVMNSCPTRHSMFNALSHIIPAYAETN